MLTEYDGIFYDYDGMGNRSNDDDWEYEWRKGRQLFSLFGGDEDWIFYYNADGMRTGRYSEISGVEYTYYYNSSLLRVMTVDGNKLCFVYDAAGTPIQLSYAPAGSTATSYYYFVTNLQGDVIAILNSSGYPVVEYTYDAWGKILSVTGSMATTLGRQNPLRYRGYVYDQETNLYYLQSRYYDPEIGRFINADVFTSTGQGLLGNNMFAYCNNNPVNYSDTNGLLPAFSHGIQAVTLDGIVGNTLNASQGDSNPKNLPPDHPNYIPPKKGPQKKKDPNGNGWGWVDKEGNVWVWTPGMHGGPGWIVQEPGGGHSHAYPGGHVRKSTVPALDDTMIEWFPASGITANISSVQIAVSVGVVVGYGTLAFLAIAYDPNWNE